MRRRPESPRHQQDHIETGATTDLNEAEMHMKLKFAFQRAETQVNLFDEDSLEGSSLGAGMLGEDSNISYSNSSIAISRNGSTDSNCGSNAEHQDVFQDPYDSSYMKSNLYGEISNNYYNEHQQTHEYANGCGSSPDDKAGSLLPDIKSPGQQQLEHFRMEKSSKKSKKGKKLSPDLRSRCSSENSVGGNTYNSHNNSSRSLDPGSSSSSVKSNNGNSLFLRKEVEAPGKAIVEQARRLHGGNNASLHRPHSRAEKQLIQR